MTVYLHAYVAKEATPTVADEINGPTVPVEEEELRRDPDGVKRRVQSEFIQWLKGNPSELEPYVEVVDGRGGKYESDDSLKLTVNEYKQQRRSGRHIAKRDHYSISITKRFQVIVQDVKTGRFVSPRSVGL